MHRTGVKLFVVLLLFLLLLVLVMIVLRDGIGGHGKRHCGKQNYDSFFHVDVEAAVPPSLPKCGREAWRHRRRPRSSETPGYMKTVRAGACACMLPINSTNEVVPGGPVSRKKPANQEISGRGRIGCAHAMCTFGRSTTAEAGIFAGGVGVARRILQHCVGAAGACGFAGLE